LNGRREESGDRTRTQKNLRVGGKKGESLKVTKLRPRTTEKEKPHKAYGGGSSKKGKEREENGRSRGAPRGKLIGLLGGGGSTF